MKQLKLFLALVFIMGVYSTSLANENDLDPRFDAASNGAVGNPTSLCNSVSEPFYQFICSFRDDEDFRAERIDLDADFEIEDYVTMEATDVPEDNSFEFYEEAWYIDVEDDNPTYTSFSASWFDASRSRVCYARGEGCEDGSIEAEVIYIFEFKNGQWFLTSYLEAASDEDGEEETVEETDDEE